MDDIASNAPVAVEHGIGAISLAQEVLEMRTFRTAVPACLLAGALLAAGTAGSGRSS
jgi:hypothetical protein